MAFPASCPVPLLGFGRAVLKGMHWEAFPSLESSSTGLGVVGKVLCLLCSCFHLLHTIWEDGNNPCGMNKWQTNFILNSADQFSRAVDAVVT